MSVPASTSSETRAFAVPIGRAPLGLGAGYSGMAGLRADFGLDVNMLGVTWEPNGMSNYVDAGGLGARPDV